MCARYMYINSVARTEFTRNKTGRGGEGVYGDHVHPSTSRHIVSQRERVLILSIRRDPFVLQCTFTKYFAPHTYHTTSVFSRAKQVVIFVIRRKKPY